MTAPDPKLPVSADFPECEQLLPHRRRICRCETGLPIDGPHGVNAYRQAWGLHPLPAPTVEPKRIRGLGDVVANTIKAVTFGVLKPCGGCRGRQEYLNSIVPFSVPEEKVKTAMNWSYGVTTVRQRLDDGLLERTLLSLRRAGFNRPRLFIDGDNRGFERFGLEMTHRAQVVRTFGNWYLGLLELTIREPMADRYAMFQDDFVCNRGLREYLEGTSYPEKGYLNLYTFPENQNLSNGREGFYESNQLGRGAVALVMSNDAARDLLIQPHMIHRPKCPHRGHKSIDGGIVEAFRGCGYREYVHNPSLIQHTGLRSSMGNGQHAQAISFRGEAWDVREMLKK